MKALTCHFHHLIIFFYILLLVSASLFCSSSSLKIGETCSKDRDCDLGLKCDTCPINGNTRPRCTRIQPIIPTSKVKGLPFNKYSWLTTHNSYAISGSTKSGTGSFLLAPTNQDDSVTSQLQNGVRGLMLDMYDFENDIWLCHSFEGKCFNFTAFQPAINTLKEVRAFLESNPTDIVTIFIEDYVTSPMGLSKVLKAAGLNKFMVPLSQMPKDGGDWPTVDDMVRKNQRLVVFTSVKSKEASEGIAYQWNYVVENQYGDEGLVNGSCPNRAESLPMNTTRISLVLENYFPTKANASLACSDNSAPLINMTKNCFKQDGKRWPNFISVDYYQRSDGGGASDAVDEANGQRTCGCRSIAYCKANGKSNSCNAPPLAPPPPAALELGQEQPSPSTPTTLSNDAHKEVHAVLLSWLYGSLCTLIILLVL